MTPETHSKISLWRAKALDGTLTQDEMKEAIKILRADRVGASIASTKSKAGKVKAETPNADDLLSEMGL